MQLCQNTIIIIWLLFLVFIFHPPGYVVVSQSFSGNCSNMTSIVNCSHRDIVYNVKDHTNDTSSFTCSVCCNQGSCCKISWNISLAIVNTTKTGYTILDAQNAMYSITLNIPVFDRMNCNNSDIIYNSTSETFHDFGGTDGVHPEIASAGLSEASTEFYETDYSYYYSSVTEWNFEFDYFLGTDVKNSVLCDKSTALHGFELDAFSGFNGTYNYLTEWPYLDEWSGLEWIDLSNNRISFITRSFGNNPLLQTLFLKNNYISVITPKVINSLPSLKYLHLNDNPAIKDWHFLNETTNLNIVDVKGSCNKVHRIFPIACGGNNVTIITDNTSCIQDVAKCTLLPSWPTTLVSVLSLVPCLKTMEQFTTTSYTTTTSTPSTVSSVHGNTSSLNLCASLNANIPFIVDNDHCTWILASGVLALFCICLVGVTLFQCRIRLTDEGRYARRLYLPKKPGSKHELELKGVSEEEGKSFKENKCTRYPPSFELPAVPVAFNISECSSEADVYSECYYTIEENAIKEKIFSEKGVCMMVNLTTGLLYNRWMGTIALSDEHRKCVVFSAVTGVTAQNKTVHWDEFVKRALELPKNTHLTNIEGMRIHQQTIYLVQEYLSCETLETRLKVDHGMDSSKTSIALKMMKSEVMRHILGILEGLALLQSYGFLHPGLSPKKVLLTNEGICKLYDFCLDEDAGNIVKMKKSQMACDINQFAPEALLRNEYTKASDVWSTAVLFWKILTESNPFRLDAQTISEDGLFPDPPSAWPIQYEALSNNKLFECWRVDSFLRPTIPELRSSFTEILDVLITESSETVSEHSKDGCTPMNKTGDGEKTEVAITQ